MRHVLVILALLWAPRAHAQTAGKGFPPVPKPPPQQGPQPPPGPQPKPQPEPPPAPQPQQQPQPATPQGPAPIETPPENNMREQPAVVAPAVSIIPGQEGGGPTAAEVAHDPLPGMESGRIDEPESDSTLRNLGQGALIVPRTVFEIAMAPFRAGAWAFDHYQLRTRFYRLFFNDALTWGLYPTVNFSTLYGITGGARLIGRDVFGDNEHFYALAATGGEYDFLADSAFRTGERLGEYAEVGARGIFEPGAAPP